jgi:hypothetical protein
MSRGYDFDDRDGDRNQEQEQPTKLDPEPQAYTGTRRDSSKPDRVCTEPGRVRDREVLPDARVNERLSFRAIEKWYRLSERERGTLREIGRLRTIDADALSKYRYAGKPAAFRHEIGRLQQQELLQRRSISVGKNRGTLNVVALSKEAAKLVRQDSQLPENQAVYVGFVNRLKSRTMRRSIRCIKPKPKKAVPKTAESDALFWTTNSRKRSTLNSLGHGIRAHSNTRVDNRRSPMSSAYRWWTGGLFCPTRIEYETPEGDLGHVDLELAPSITIAATWI